MRKKFVIMVVMLMNLSSIACISAASELTTDVTTGAEVDAMENIIELPPAFQRDLLPHGTTPDSWLYGFKKFFEGVDLFFTSDDVAKAEKHAYLAELRLAEAKEMAENGKPNLLQAQVSSAGNCRRLQWNGSKRGRNARKGIPKGTCFRKIRFEAAVNF